MRVTFSWFSPTPAATCAITPFGNFNVAAAYTSTPLSGCSTPAPVTDSGSRNAFPDAAPATNRAIETA